jgi:hypothetical protein
MTDEKQTHIKLEFNRNAGQIVEWLAVDQETLRQAQLWLVRQQQPTAVKLSDWLRSNGGVLDRADGPALVATNATGTHEEWCSRGLRDRADGPAVIATGADGSRYEAWYSKDLLDHADGPAIIVTRADGTCRESWYSKGTLVKEETNARISAIPGVTLYPAGP